MSVSDDVSTSATKTEFEAETFIKVGEIENIGEFGSEFSAVTFTSLDDRLVRKFKGTEDPGTLALALGLDPDDTGQAQLQTALASDAEFSFKIELNDGETTPTTYYFRGRVMSFKQTVGGAADVVKASCSIGINTRPLMVAAT
ncbi:hypothetical protein THS27_25510 [Thalassospira sp. MCCC 1A01428]|nr:hypothetical protein THS27_25510 [Thalassospira sp. MCCC 1A01428]